MKIFVVGSTGPTGLRLLEQALARGHEVVTVVRSPDKITMTDDKLKVFKGSVTDASSMTEHMRGCDAVLSTIGGQRGMNTPCSIYTETGRALVQAMREVGVKRLVICHAWGSQDHPELHFIWRRVFRKTMLRNLLKDMGDCEDYLSSECLDLNVTVVRPGILSNRGSSGETPAVAMDRFSVPRGCGDNWTISRTDVAIFMLNCLDNDKYVNKSMAII